MKIDSSFDEVISIIEKNRIYFKEKINIAVKLLINVIKKKKTIFWAGNGGSAAESLHMSAELVGRFNMNRKPISSITLSSDMPSTTAIGNDYGFENIFSRQLEALGKNGDILIVMSTSGKSKNLINLLKVAKYKKIKSFALLGKGGGKCKLFSDFNIIIDSKNTARIQEIHHIILHIICENIEKEILNDKNIL